MRKYLYEMHFHTKNTSNCANVPAEIAVEEYIKAGYDGIVVTDHMNSSAFSKEPYKNATWDEKVTHFLPGSYPVFSLTLPSWHDIIVTVKILPTRKPLEKSGGFSAFREVHHDSENPKIYP